MEEKYLSEDAFLDLTNGSTISFERGYSLPEISREYFALLKLFVDKFHVDLDQAIVDAMLIKSDPFQVDFKKSDEDTTDPDVKSFYNFTDQTASQME